MHIAQPLLEPHHRLAAGMEAEVARLDDSGMDGPDRDLMQARTLGLEEGICVRRAVVGFHASERMTQRPSAVIEPAPVVGRSDRGEAEKIAGRPLEPARRRMKRRHGGKRAAIAGDVDDSERAVRLPQRHPHAALVAPQADERSFARGEPARSLAPGGLALENDRRFARSCGRPSAQQFRDVLEPRHERGRQIDAGHQHQGEMGEDRQGGGLGRRGRAGRRAERHALHPQDEGAERDEKAEGQQQARARARARKSS